MTDEAAQSLQVLLAGNDRFQRGEGTLHQYSAEELSELATGQSPLAAILTCSDSRVAPEVIFDQPLGKVFAARTPGNVSADSVKWMIDIAVDELGVPLMLIVGHTGCLAVTQIVNGEMTGAGGHLRAQISSALTRAKSRNPVDLLTETVRENVYQTIERLRSESTELRRALDHGKASIAGAIYDMHTGDVAVLPER